MVSTHRKSLQPQTLWVGQATHQSFQCGLSRAFLVNSALFPIKSTCPGGCLLRKWRLQAANLQSLAKVQGRDMLQRRWGKYPHPDQEMLATLRDRVAKNEARDPSPSALLAVGKNYPRFDVPFTILHPCFQIDRGEGGGVMGKEMFTQYKTMKGKDNAFGKAKKAFSLGCSFQGLFKKKALLQSDGKRAFP